MKHVVYFFSGTGNSLAVVKELEKAGAHAVSMTASDDKQILCDCEKVGFVFPVYYLGLPEIVHNFLDRLEMRNSKYVYVIYTMGWNLRGGVAKQMKAHLSEKDVKLNMASCIQMPMNDFTLANVHDPEQQKKLLGKFKKSMNVIIDRVIKEKTHFSFEPIGFMVEKRNKPFCSQCNQNDEKFSISDDCKGCGICQKVCPVGNIDIKDNRPVWKHSCQNCMACFHYCPKKAISYGGKGAEITHYHHPDISVFELEKYHKLS